MTEYVVLFATKLSAKSNSDLNRKAEATADAMSKSLNKRVYAYGYGHLEKKDTVQTNLDEKEMK